MYISIVIPTYNRPQYLDACLESLRSQTGTADNVEIIVVDDRSGEKSAEENRLICSRHKTGYHLHNSNRRMAVTRNTGIIHSKGEWIVFLDDDVRVSEGWFNRLNSLLSQIPSTVLGIEGRVEGSGPGVWDREVQNLTGKAFLTCHFVLRKSILEKISGFDSRFEFLGPFCEDHELAARVLMWGEIIFDEKLSVTHLPRHVNLFNYIRNAPRRVRGLLRAEFFFYRKHPDRYHIFRHASTFWGTLISVLFRNLLNDIRRRSPKTLLSHPLQTAGLVAGSLLEQFYAWFLVPEFIKTWLSEGAGLIGEQCDFQKTAKMWSLQNGTINSLKLPFSPYRSLLFKLQRKPVYDLRITLSKLGSISQLKECTIFLRVDDVFLEMKEQVVSFCKILQKAQIPYLAAVTGDDLIKKDNLDLVNMLFESGAAVGLHGFSHKGNYGAFASELLQISFPQFMEKLKLVGKHSGNNLPPYILVPPFNAIGPEQVVQLSNHFKVICAGPETARFTGRLAGPIAICDSWYFPSFFPYYGSANSILKSGALKDLRSMGGIVCVTVHFTEEAMDNFVRFEELLRSLPVRPKSWDFFKSGMEDN